MNKRSLVFAQSFLVAALFAMPLFAGDDEALKKDLTAVIALQSLPCVQVVEVKTLAKDDYTATCKDKNKYHIYLNPKGRVMVEKSK